MPIDRRRRLEAGVLVATATLFALAVVPGRSATASEPLLPLDDSYIFLRFAQQLVDGHPLEWTDRVVSSGATSLAQLLLVAPGQIGGELGLAVRWSQFVGWLALLALGFAAHRLLRAVGLTGVLPVVGASTVILSGPIGWGAMAGMESALNAAAVLASCALLTDFWRHRSPAGRRRVLFLVALLAALPLVRPENAVLTTAAVATALFLPAIRGHRFLLALAFLPGAALAALYAATTGTAKPAGVLAKSITEFAFVDPGGLVDIYGFNLLTKVLPVYLGWRGPYLWAPVGWIVLAVSVGWPVFGIFRRVIGRRDGERRNDIDPRAAARSGVADRNPPGRRHAPGGAGLAVPIAGWWLLFLIAPLSAMVEWQYMRHHHAGLALAWTIAFAATALTLERVRRGGAFILAAAPVLLAICLPVWREAYVDGVTSLRLRHGAAGDWLAARSADDVLLVNDAGYLAVRYDGPMVDALGLGTPALARPYRHGPGASVETLARQQPLPSLAAVNRGVFHLPALLGRALGPPPGRESDTRIAEVHRDRLAGTSLESDGVDFAFLGSEEAATERLALSWSPPPSPREPSRVVEEVVAGRVTLDGCRPLSRAVQLRVPLEGAASLRVFAPSTTSGEVVARDGSGRELGRVIVPAGGSRELTVPLAATAPPLRFERVSPGIPCLESLRLVETADDRSEADQS